jgi:hypothetical protein
MNTTYSFANYLDIYPSSNAAIYRFQNFYINEDAYFTDANTGTTNTFGFLAFGFSGVTLTKASDNEPAALIFPNNSLTRGWIETAVRDYWICNVRTLLVNPDNKMDYRFLSRYISQIVSASWDSQVVKLELASVLDAVGTDLPRKRLTQQLVGSLPVTASVRF